MSLPLRPNVCLLIVNQDNLVFIGERFDCDGVWQFPQGGVENPEHIELDALREAAEELGAKEIHFQIIRKLATTNDYDFVKQPEYAIGVWRGQSQTFWLIRFSGNDCDIKLDAYHPEFQKFKWCTRSEVESIAETKRLPAYLKALAECPEILN